MKHYQFARKRLIRELSEENQWDVLIIGGGATGLGIAVDAATRGYRTLLLEQVDFAKGTSSRSTKLVHGGIRYLAQGNVELVREALNERGLLAQNAPHLVKKQKFVIPNYAWWEGLYYNFGLKTYDFLAGKLSMGKSASISLKKIINRFPTLIQEDLRGGVEYMDGQFDDARLAINLAQTCIENDGYCLNHFKVINILKDKEDMVNGVEAIEEETGKSYRFHSRLVINATGVFVDYIRNMANPTAKKIIRASQGVHLVFDKEFFPGKHALMIPKTDDGRVLFAVPWKDKVLVGTTDTLLEKPSLEPVALEEEIDFILNNFNKYLIRKVSRKDVKSIFAGLRPLAASGDDERKTKEISRGHKIMLSGNGLLSITGGKWTTYRKMAEDTLDYAIEHKFLPFRECVTENFLIHGATSQKTKDSHLQLYGSDKTLIFDLINERPELGVRLDEELPFLKAEVVWAVQYEMARTLEDVLARRVRALFLDSAAAIRMAPEVAKIMAWELGRDKDWIENQLLEFKEVAKHYMLKKEKTA
ncbi:glycerol-3-phosphate dehydrogenase/oxidase [Christiangramia fulva]|uniref:glycerol-3-phosphate dehydrogenase/oxidase n=1 Tax=Christiangramia fulva TaxID=2126553 RepID=UPI00269C7EFA